MAIRWSPRASTVPPRGRAGTPRTSKPSGRAPRCARRSRAAPSATASIRSVSFAPQLARRRVTTRLAARERREQRDERQLVDEPRHLVGVRRRRDELRVLRPRGRRPARRRAAAVEDGDARAHPLEHVEQPGAARVEADVVDGDVAARGRARPRRGTAPPRRSRPGRRTSPSRSAPAGSIVTDAGRRRDAHAGRLEHQLGVVARRRRLDHGRRAGRASPASRIADFTCALATGSS